MMMILLTYSDFYLRNVAPGSVNCEFLLLRVSELEWVIYPKISNRHIIKIDR